MFKKLFYSVFVLAILLFLNSCASSEQIVSKESTEQTIEVTKNKKSDEKSAEDYSTEAYEWNPPLFTQDEIKPEKKLYENLFNFGFPTSVNISNVPPASSVPYAIIDDPNRGRLYITDFPIRNEENSFTIGK